jgi:hypothetical protein
VATADPANTGTRTAVTIAGAIYVLAWIIGLMVAPAAPDPTASDTAIHAFFLEHESATLLQASIVHGVAGLALAVFVVALARLLAPGQRDAAKLTLLIAGLGAATVSLVQLGIEVALNRHVAGGGAPATTASLFHAINIADTVKLVLLGIAIAAASRLAAHRAALPRWLRGLGYALLPILVVGGLAFIIDSAVLTMVLDASLLLLLVWAAAVSLSARRPQGAHVTAVAR